MPATVLTSKKKKEVKAALSALDAKFGDSLLWDNSYKPCHGVGTAVLVNHKFLSMKGGDGKYHVVLSPCEGGHASPLEWSAKAVFDTKPSGQDVKDAMLNDGPLA